MKNDRFGLTLEQTEILYNLEYYKTLNDIKKTDLWIGKDKNVQLRKDWLAEWGSYMKSGFPDFVNDSNAILHWYTVDELLRRIKENNPSEVWFRLVLLETMIFEPYYPLSLVKNKKGEDVPSTKYRDLQDHIWGYGFNKDEGDKFIETFFQFQPYYKSGYIKRLRNCYDKALGELNEVLKTRLNAVAIAGAAAVFGAVAAAAFAGPIAVALVGGNFLGLHGAALISACLAYIGGGAIAAGGAGMLGGTVAIVGGGALLGAGMGAGVGGAIGAVSLMGKEGIILQSAKLMVSVREIFLNDEHDIEYSNSVYEQYVKNIVDIEKSLVELKHQADTASSEDKKELEQKIKKAEETVHAMKIAMKSLNKFKSSFELGTAQT